MEVVEAYQIDLEAVMDAIDMKTFGLMAAIGKIELDNFRERASMGSLTGTDCSANGMQPVRLFPDRRSSLRFHRLPSSAGMEPVNSLSDRSRVSSADRPPISGGMTPSRSSSSRSSPVTRVELAFRVIPSHDEMVVDAFQSNVAVPAKVACDSSSAPQSRTSPGFRRGSLTAGTLAQAGTGGGWDGVNVAVEPSSGVMSP